MLCFTASYAVALALEIAGPVGAAAVAAAGGRVRRGRRASSPTPGISASGPASRPGRRCPARTTGISPPRGCWPSSTWRWCSTSRGRRSACSCCRSCWRSSPWRAAPRRSRSPASPAPRFWGMRPRRVPHARHGRRAAGLRRRADVPACKATGSRKSSPPTTASACPASNGSSASTAARSAPPPCSWPSASSPASSRGSPRSTAASPGPTRWCSASAACSRGSSPPKPSASPTRPPAAAARWRISRSPDSCSWCSRSPRSCDTTACMGEQRGAEERAARSKAQAASNSSLLAPRPSPLRRRLAMNLRMVGCTHRATGVDVRQQLAFGDHQVGDALDRWRERFPAAELVLALHLQPRRALRRRRRLRRRARERRSARRPAQLPPRAGRARRRARS